MDFSDKLGSFLQAPDGPIAGPTGTFMIVPARAAGR